MEAVGRDPAGDLGDHIAADEKDRQEVKEAGKATAPERLLHGRKCLIGHRQ
jgi:hypothetical protein